MTNQIAPPPSPREVELELQLERTMARVKVFESILEDKTRELFLNNLSLTEANRDMTAILDALPTAILVTDAAFEVQLANDTAKSMLRCELNERPLADVVPSRKLAEWLTADVPAQKSEEDVLSIQGKQVPVLVSLSERPSRDGEPTGGYILVLLDLTAKRELEQKLLQAEKLESIGRLAAGVAHEINTPIQYVRDNVTFLEREFKVIAGLLERSLASVTAAAAQGAESAEITSLLEDAKKADLSYLLAEIPTALHQTLEGADGVARIVRSMKEFSHPGNVDRSYIDLNAAIESTVTVSRNEWKYVADLKLELSPELPLINCYPGELNQVFLNMIINSAHAIEDCERAPGEKGTITISTKATEHSVVIELSDTGVGIPEKIKAKIYDPFFTTKAVGRGSGQGLAIAYSTIVERHHGSITCDSEPGKGTKFKIVLPIHG